MLLKYSAFPYQKFGAHWGTVASISQAALKPDEVESLRGKTVTGRNAAGKGGWLLSTALPLPPTVSL